MPYQPPSQRRGRGATRSKKGPIIFCCILALIGAFVAFVVYESRQPEPEPPKVTIEKPKPEKPSADPSIATENTKRSQDARAVYYAGGNFYRANANVYPTAYAKGQVTGAPGSKPQPLAFQHYKTMAVASGAQKPIKTDEIRFVYNAVCAASESATVANANAYSYVVQFSLQQPDGTYTANCLRM